MYADRLFNALERNEPGPGQLLVAAPGMQSQFARSVILLLEDNLGVVLTMRSDMAVFNVLPEWAPVVSKPQALYIGGPLNQQSVLGLAMTRPGTTASFLTPVAPRLALVDLRVDPEQVREEVTGLRLFAGCAEWAPGQLDEEISAGYWYVTPALAQDVVTPGPADLWADVMRRQPMPLPLYATFPAHVG